MEALKQELEDLNGTATSSACSVGEEAAEYSLMDSVKEEPQNPSSTTDANGVVEESVGEALTVGANFLGSASRVHTTPFSAIAELVDNAYDPGCQAENVYIDVYKPGGTFPQAVLEIRDDGAGLDREGLTAMLNYGYSRKELQGPSEAAFSAIGRYGTGFKTSSMKLGKDVLVLSKSLKSGATTFVAGLLSQTLQERTGKPNAQIIKLVLNRDLEPATDGDASALESLLRHCPILPSFEQLKRLLSEIRGRSGTRILVYELALDDEGRSELDCSMPGDLLFRGAGGGAVGHLAMSWRYSLRRFLALLFYKPRIRIHIRGQEVPIVPIEDSIIYQQDVTIQIQGSDGVEMADVRFGIKKKKGQGPIVHEISDYGALFYHRNRLIQAYEPLPGQIRCKQARAFEVIALVRADFLAVSVNKAQIVQNDKYTRLLRSLGKRFNTYRSVYLPSVDPTEFVARPGGMKKLNESPSMPLLLPPAAKRPRMPYLERSLHPLTPPIVKQEPVAHASWVMMEENDDDEIICVGETRSDPAASTSLLPIHNGTTPNGSFVGVGQTPTSRKSIQRRPLDQQTTPESSDVCPSPARGWPGSAAMARLEAQLAAERARASELGRALDATTQALAESDDRLWSVLQRYGVLGKREEDADGGALDALEARLQQAAADGFIHIRSPQPKLMNP